MTRFARAKGSKASNEKTPEDSTPWEVMKQQLLSAKKESEEAKQRQEVEQQRIDNYQKFLKDQKTQKRKATWCDFPEVTSHKKVSDNQPQNSNLKHNNKKSNGNIDISVKKQVSDTNLNSKSNQKNDKLSSESNNEDLSPKKKKKGKNKPKQCKNNDVIQPTTEIIEQEIISKKAKKKKSKDTTFMEGHTRETQDLVASANKNTTNSDVEAKQDTNSKEKLNKKKKNKKQKENNESTAKKEQAVEAKTENNQPKKQKKFIDKNKTKPNRRKPIPDNSFQLIINGKDVELVRFDGFPIMKKDAERLNDLKQNMMRRGIPKSEVQRNMKLERRRAEKALARLKRDVCYNCRKGGHNLSDCPELKSKIPGAEAPDGICFKCGSTEHRQFECKVQKEKEFRFATCFICKESGHIARQCPDNPKGLYPNGGCCKLCGDVTHLRKDCPTVNEQKESTSIKLATLDSAENIEEITQKPNTATEPQLKKPKKITF